MKQSEALEILKMGHNVYLTGAAGSGKTHLLNQYINFLKKKGVAIGVTASTGIAATHMNGSTIHSWAGIGIKKYLDEWEFDALLQKQYLAKRFQNTKVLIIDEVSMLDFQRFDLLDKVCRGFKQTDAPFGGMQVILSGDFFQLPPITKNTNEFSFINKSDVWNNMNLKVCYLQEQYRQEDSDLVEMLNNIRRNNVGEDVLVPLRTRYKKEIHGDITPTKLYTHNADIDRINEEELAKVEGKLKVYEMITKGRKNLVESLKKSCLAQEELRLKEGATVMFLKNNHMKKYANGTLGKVIGFSKMDFPIVKTYEGKEIEVEPESWTIEDEGKVKAELKQIPLRLAWAITIHKSQGMSLDAAEIDLSKSFVEGLGYVALSRIRSFEGLRLMGLNKIALEVNKEILELDKELLTASEYTLGELSEVSEEEIKEKQKGFMGEVEPAEEEKIKKLSTYEVTKILVDNKLSIKEIAKERDMTEGTIVSHLEKMLEWDSKEGGLNKKDLNYIKKEFDKKRLDKILKAFKKTKDTKLSSVKKILGDKFDYDEIRLARLFL